MRVRTSRRLVALLLTAIAAAVGAVAFAAPAHAVGPNYRIINYNSGKCLQPQSSNANALIEQSTCTAGSWNTVQQWNIDYHPGTFDLVFTNVWSGMCLDIQVNDVRDIVPGVPAQQFWCASAVYPTERWLETSPVRPGHVQLPSRANTSMCLDIRNDSKSSGALAVMNRCRTADPGQAFRYEIV